jgi:hypothetical protein
MSFNTILVMATIVSSYDLAPLSSVMVCWNNDWTTLNMSFRDELFTLGSWTDWLGTCWLCLKEGRALICPTVVGQACATEGGWGCCCSFLVLHSTTTNKLDKSKWKSCYAQRPIGPSALVSSPNLRPKTRFLLLSVYCSFVDVGSPLWQEDGSVI